MYRPVVWSTCPSTRTIAAIALSRTPRAGCSTGFACSCALISGDALTSAQAVGDMPQTAIDDWVRARVWRVPSRKPPQLRQLQFHCGKPPPAADPSTRIFTKKARPACAGYASLISAIGNVHRDFHAEPEISRLRCFPFHTLLLQSISTDGLRITVTLKYRRPRSRVPRVDTPLHSPSRTPDHHERRLMIFMRSASVRAMQQSSPPR